MPAPSSHRWLALGSLFALFSLAAAGGGHGSEDPNNPCGAAHLEDYDRNMRIGAIFIILVTSITGAVLPLLIRRFAQNLDSIFLSCGKLFGAGVILATGFIHMFPHAAENLTSECLSSAFTEDYTAYAGLFAMLAILFVQFLQVTASIYLQENARRKGAEGNSSSELTASPTRGGFEVDCDNTTTATTTLSAIHPNHMHHAKELDAEKGRHSHSNHAHGAGADAGHAHAIIFDARIEKRVGTYVLELGIASHSVIIGIALGTAADDEFRTLLIALVFHQFFEGLSLATIIMESDFRSRFLPIAMILFYGITTPVGVAIGVGVHESYNGNAETTLLTTGILDAISAGILIYDALVNILTPHLSCPMFRDTTNMRRFAQMLSLWAGAAIMAVLGKWA